MNHVIAVAGKGGVGKTSLSGLLVLRLVARDKTPILAVDADPNTCLDQVLGVKAETSVGALREDLDQANAQGMDKRRYLELKIAEALTEGDDFDLVAMGRPEGAGCYCYANAVLKDVLSTMTSNYPYVVIDNEAGMENLSRRLVAKAQSLVLVGDGSRRGLETVRRLHALAGEMKIEYDRLAIVVNRIKQAAPPRGLDRLQKDTSADALITLDENDELAKLDSEGQSLENLDESNPLIRKVDELLDVLISD